MTTFSDARPSTTSLPRRHASGRRRITRWMWALLVIDAAVLMTAAITAWQGRLLLNPLFREPIIFPSTVPVESVGLVLLWLGMIYLQGGYSFRHVEAGFDLYRALGTATILASGLAAIVMYLSERDFTRSYFLGFFALGLLLLAIVRYGLRQYLYAQRRQGRWGHRVVGVGDAESIADAIRVFSREQHLGYEIVSVVSRPSAVNDRLPIGEFDDIQEICRHHQADTVLIAGGSCSAADLKEVGWALHGEEVDIIVLPSLLDVAGPRVHFRVDGGLPRVHVTEPQASRAVSIGKRLFDVTVSGALLLILALPLAIVALFVKIEDGGPVLFRQSRVGMNGRVFRCWKFRSMRVHASTMEARMRAEQAHKGAMWKMASDPRVTRFGGFIRRFSLDELPQLFNVLFGEMSLVGPRPQQQWEVDTYSTAQRRRLLVKPGMTGLWQVSGRSTLALDEAVRLDLYYVENWTMFVDIVIMLRTVKAVLGSQGAY